MYIFSLIFVQYRAFAEQLMKDTLLFLYFLYLHLKIIYKNICTQRYMHTCLKEKGKGNKNITDI